MFDFLYQSGWGAFVAMLFFQLPFLVVFLYVVYRKAFTDPSPSDIDDKRISRLDVLWLTVTIVLFTGVNLASVGYMPTILTAEATSSEIDIQDIDVTAQSWSYAISERQLLVGRPVRLWRSWFHCRQSSATGWWPWVRGSPSCGTWQGHGQPEGPTRRLTPTVQMASSASGTGRTETSLPGDGGLRLGSGCVRTVGVLIQVESGQPQARCLYLVRCR